MVCYALARRRLLRVRDGLRLGPLAYATDVIDKIQNGWPLLRMAELLPDVWTRPVAQPVATDTDAGTASPNA